MGEGNQTKTRANQSMAKLILVVLVLLIVYIGSLVAIPIAYSKKILPKVSVAGINLGGTDIGQAKNILAYESQNFEKMRVHLKYGKKIFAPALSQLGVSVDVDQTIQKAYQYGRDTNFFTKLKNHFALLAKQTEVLYVIKVDEKKYNGYFRKLAKYVKRPPVNARLEIIGNEIKFIPGKIGMTLDPESAKAEIIESLTRGDIKTYLLHIKKDEPYIQEPQTENAKMTAEEWMKAKITINIFYDQKAEQTRKDQSFSLSCTDIGQWITFKEGVTELEAGLSSNAISGWLADVNSQATIPAINNKVNIANGKEELLSKGKAGQGLETKALVIKVAAAVKSGEGIFKIKTKPLPPQNEIIGGVIPGRFKGKYIEVVLSQQKMYVFDGKKLISTFLVSTGKVSKPTPVGTFKILTKTTWASCTPSPTEYRTCYMPYSMFFTNLGHAIHALPIIDGYQEGMWHLGVRVSHGCIRLAPDAAVTMYNWTPVGTPVIIHY